VNSHRIAPIGRMRRWFAGALLVLVGAGCSDPWILPGGPSDHEFVLGAEKRQSIRKISVWFQPGHVLEWELVRAQDEARSRLPLAFLDYGEVPAAMDQNFPKGRPEPMREGQTVIITMEYSLHADLDSVVPNQVTRWYRKESHGFKEVSEMEESDPRAGRNVEKKPDRP
jgi:hypothetical protein